jgi:hypothetical protein
MGQLKLNRIDFAKHFPEKSDVSGIVFYKKDTDGVIFYLFAHLLSAQEVLAKVLFWQPQALACVCNALKKI